MSSRLPMPQFAPSAQTDSYSRTEVWNVPSGCAYTFEHWMMQPLWQGCPVLLTPLRLPMSSRAASPLICAVSSKRPLRKFRVG